jgi:hypothetical protein
MLSELWFNPSVSLSQQQKDCLRDAIERYDFPSDYFDFGRNSAEHLANTKDVEVRIGRHLTSGDPERVKNGLSNVLYWGYAQMGIRDTRVQHFRSKVNVYELKRACDLFRRSGLPSVLEIKDLGLPEFSGLSFVSKIRVFLDPDKSAALDRQIMKIHQHCATTLLANLRIGRSTQIPITEHHSEVYEAWCRRMVNISDMYFDARFRAVDIERGLFQLIQERSVEAAARILNDA